MIDKIKRFYANNKPAVLTIGAVAAFLLLTSNRGKVVKKSGTTPIENSNVSPAVPPQNGYSGRKGFPLKNGSRGIYVKALQRWLNAQRSQGIASFAELKVDGIFGNKTLSALRLVWNELEGYPIREVNETQYLSQNIHLYE